MLGGDSKMDGKNYEELNLEQKMLYDVRKVLGSEKIMDFTYFEEIGMLTIHYKASDYSSERTLQYGHLKIYEEVFENYEVKDVSLFSHMNLFDQYGQETDKVTFRSRLTKDIASKINWDNFITTNLPDIAESYYIHPTLL